jgi:hypothetical protein
MWFVHGHTPKRARQGRASFSSQIVDLCQGDFFFVSGLFLVNPVLMSRRWQAPPTATTNPSMSTSTNVSSSTFSDDSYVYLRRTTLIAWTAASTTMTTSTTESCSWQGEDNPRSSWDKQELDRPSSIKNSSSLYHGLQPSLPKHFLLRGHLSKPEID